MDPTAAIYFSVFGEITRSVLGTFWFIIWLFVPRLYKYNVRYNDPQYSTLLNKLTGWHINKRADGNPTGTIVGRWYIATVTSSREDGSSIDIICSRKFIEGCERKTADDDDIALINYVAKGQYYTLRKIMLTPTREQRRVLTRINAAMTKYKNGVYLLWGPPGTGKSCIVDMLAIALKFAIKPDVSFRDLNVFTLSGRITVINEIDGVLDVLIGAKENKAMAEFYTKANWNDMLDFVNSNANTILILTTNVDPATYDKVDPSLLRAARIRMRARMTRVIA